MAARHLNLFFNQVEVVQQPLRRMGDAPGLPYGLGHAVVRPKDLLVLVQARQELIGAATGDDLMNLRQSCGMTNQLFNA